MRATLGLLIMLTGCGPSVLRNAPRPDPAKVAVVAAGVATALTLADTAGQEANVEDAYLAETPDDKPMRVTGRVPADVLDRLDGASTPRR